MVVISSSFSAPEQGVLFQSPNTKLLINDQEFGTANLFITQDNVIWGGGIDAKGELPTISLLYPTISLHAIQREPTPALYMIINFELRLPGMKENEGQDDDDEFDAEDQPITQLRFVPQDESDLHLIFSALSQGQALHPDSADVAIDGMDEDDDEFEDAEETNGSPEEATARLNQLRLENINGIHQEDYEDAEADE